MSTMSAVRRLHKTALNGEPVLFIAFFFLICHVGLRFKLTAWTKTYSIYQITWLVNQQCEHSILQPVFSVMEESTPEETITSSFGRFIQSVQPKHLSPVVLQRSKRMVLDNIGVGLLGSTTEVFDLILQHCQVIYILLHPHPIWL